MLDVTTLCWRCCLADHQRWPWCINSLNYFIINRCSNKIFSLYRKFFKQCSCCNEFGRKTANFEEAINFCMTNILHPFPSNNSQSPDDVFEGPDVVRNFNQFTFTAITPKISVFWKSNSEFPEYRLSCNFAILFSVWIKLYVANHLQYLYTLITPKSISEL